MRPAAFFSLFRIRLVLMIILVVVPAFGLVLYGSLEQRRVQKSQVRTGAVAISRLAAANQESFIKHTRQLLATLTQFPFLLLSTNHHFSHVHLSNLRKLSPDYLNFGLIETNGVLFCSAEPSNSVVNLSDRAYFRRVLETRKFSIGDFQVGRVTGEPGLNFGYPVLDEQGQLTRVLYASLRLSRLSEVITHIQLPAGGSVTVLDRNGNILARHPEPEKWVGKSVMHLPLVQRLLSQREDVFEMPGLDGKPRLHAVTAIQDDHAPSLFVSIGIPVSVVFAQANQALLRNCLILVFVALGVLLAARLYAQRFLIQPINALVAVANKWAEGDLSARTGRLNAAAELVQLGTAFATMAERLQRRQSEIEQLNRSLENRVTERTAQLEAANKELEAFSYSVSHDLRAPLRHIGGFVTLLKENAGPVLDETSLRHLDFVSSSAKQMGQLVDDLLSFSKTARVSLQVLRVDLAQMVEETRKALHPEMEQRVVEWKIGPLPQVEADPALLRVVLTNLLSNALKYSRPKAPARIEVDCQSGAREAIIRVRDNGVGFDMNYASNLFGVFQRLHAEEQFEGTGIGLAMVQRIILRHGGRVWAEAKEGEGATFYFSLPVNVSSANPSGNNGKPSASFNA
jgi:signal transduction histidine kinase